MSKHAHAQAYAQLKEVDYAIDYSPLVKNGRPSTYDPRYCEDVISFMTQGYSLSAYADYAQVDRKTLSDWQASNPKFDLAVTRAKASRLRHWERRAIEVARTGGNGSQATMIIFGLKNMGSDEWKERIEHTGQITLAALVESSMKAIAERSNGEIIEGESRELPAGNSDAADFFD